jgi:hypothetical protein
VTVSLAPTLALVSGLSLLIHPGFAQTDDDPPRPAAAPSARVSAEDQALWKRLDLTEDGWLDGKELEGGWKKYDADGDGEVTRAEFMAGRAQERQRAGGSPEEDAQRFRQLDASGNGCLSGTELAEGNTHVYDSDHDGRVTLAEYLAGRARERGAVGVTAPAPARTLPARPSRATPPPAPAARHASATAPRRVPARPAPLIRVEQPPAPRISGGGPVGLYFMTRFWSYTGTLEKAAWYFAPDGRVYQNLETGFSAGDLAAHQGP